jgi:hypothetical protein
MSDALTVMLSRKPASFLPPSDRVGEEFQIIQSKILR